MIAASARPWPGVGEPFWWAVRALRNELWGFRFDYPLEAVPAAGPKGSLHYHVYSERLFFDVMDLDAQGIPLQRSRLFGETYNPAYVAWYGLANLERALRGVDAGGESAFLKQVEWLAVHATRRDDDGLVWPYTFDWREGGCLLKAPWISAMSQGLAMSALVRGYRITRRPALLDLALAASRVFEKGVEDGGVRTLDQGRILFEEYPGHPLPRVLDGFLFGLLGLHDLAIETGDPQASQLLSDGVEGLSRALEFWNYRDKWTRYGSHGYLSPPHYHKLNGVLLTALAKVTGNTVVARYAEMWGTEKLSRLDRAEIFLAFVMTKNWARLRLPRG